jgi:ABC-type Fe3+-siderophore transport system permease subunit
VRKYSILTLATLLCLGVFAWGGAFLVLRDAVARTTIAPTEIPVGVIATLIGGPCFIYLLIQKKIGGLSWK